MQKRKRSGFTLIELLIVVLIILLLSGLLFRIGTLVVDRSNRGQAIAELQTLANVLEEFYAEYGMYPPATTMGYVYENVDLQPPSLAGSGEEISDEELGYRYGLVSYLVPRDRSNPDADYYPQRRDYKADTDRDEQAKQRWAHYLEELTIAGGLSANSLDLEGEQVYTNSFLTIRDPWGSQYNYESRPPYQSYRLWSSNLD